MHLNIKSCTKIVVKFNRLKQYKYRTFFENRYQFSEDSSKAKIKSKMFKSVSLK